MVWLLDCLRYKFNSLLVYIYWIWNSWITPLQLLISSTYTSNTGTYIGDSIDCDFLNRTVVYFRIWTEAKQWPLLCCENVDLVHQQLSHCSEVSDSRVQVPRQQVWRGAVSSVQDR